MNAVALLKGFCFILNFSGQCLLSRLCQLMGKSVPLITLPHRGKPGEKVVRIGDHHTLDLE